MPPAFRQGRVPELARWRLALRGRAESSTARCSSSASPAAPSPSASGRGPGDNYLRLTFARRSRRRIVSPAATYCKLRSCGNMGPKGSTYLVCPEVPQLRSFRVGDDRVPVAGTAARSHQGEHQANRSLRHHSRGRCAFRFLFLSSFSFGALCQKGIFRTPGGKNTSVGAPRYVS